MKSIKKVATVDDLVRLIPSICWLWPGWIPRGFVSLLVGISGIGKSMIALAIAKCVNTPSPWPDGQDASNNPEIVLWVDCEAAQAVLADRVKEWDLLGDRIILPGEDPLSSISLSSEEDKSKLINIIDNERPELVVVDSLGASHGGDENSTRDMGRVLGFTAELARDKDIAILIVHHLRKRGQNESAEINLDRVRGSSVITSFARSVIALEKIGEGLRLSVAKSNLSKIPPALGVTIGDSGPSFGDAPVIERKPTKSEITKGFLRETLAKGPRSFSELEAMGMELGISKRSLYDARSQMEIETIKNKWVISELELLEALFDDLESRF